MAEPTPLTPEQKEEFKKKGREFRELGYNIAEQIECLNIQIRNLEKKIRDSVPKTPNGRMVCESCYVKSMAYLGRTPQGGSSGGDDIYECEICGSDRIGRVMIGNVWL
jgi:hypothetical protein